MDEGVSERLSNRVLWIGPLVGTQSVLDLLASRDLSIDVLQQWSKGSRVSRLLGSLAKSARAAGPLVGDDANRFSTNDGAPG